MTSPANLPSFFGRATAVLGEHAHLHVLVSKLRRRCTGKLAPDDPADLRALLDEFVALLDAHFAAEEDDGYFGTLTAASSAAATIVEELRAEHTVFLQDASMLRARVRDRTPEHEVTPLLSALLDDLAAHERAESELMRCYITEGAL